MYGGACHGQHMPKNVKLAFLSCFKTSYLGQTVASHSHTQGAKIHNSKCALRDKNIRSFACDEV